MNPEGTLAGQVALVTGGSKGIGLEIARRRGARGSRPGDASPGKLYQRGAPADDARAVIRASFSVLSVPSVVKTFS
jgi:NAD(P)-dependent dehydrogenase (short-subunit alcohol dehydrogenase family)